MSIQLINFAKEFVAAKVSADRFSDPYMKKWKAERDSGISKKDSDAISECCSSIFVLADCYNPESDRRESEVDEAGLRKEVKAILEKFKLL
ncbi:Microcin-D immunity protein [Serratia entomophila]|uniref:colicin immunity domain-containing protein n=1 Tax=Serratia entomophila TaxID=42906 RepID=UPI0021778D64|nr:colicin immunity domain-containing protein [Serratia entomophila]CAI1965401.1 Microcin-D immunity protein [Serratia entomophila]